MSIFFKGLALLVAVSCLAWISVLWHWRSTAHTPTAEDLLGYLVLLPLVAFGLVLLLRLAWRAGASHRAAASAAAAAAGAAPAAAPAAPAPAARPPLQLLGAALACAVADAPPALLAAAQAGQPLPRLHPELRDDDGLPVMCHAIDDLDPAAVEQAWAALAATRDGAGTEAPPADHGAGGEPPPARVLRALAALQAPLCQVLKAVPPWWPAAASVASAPSSRSSAAPAAGAVNDAAPRLRLLLGWPADWSAPDRTRADAWVRGLLADIPDLPPAERVLLTSLPLGGAELWLEAERRLQANRAERRPELLLVAAAHSDLADEGVSALQRQRRLFSPGQHPKGLMPAESACALLLAPDDWPAPGADAGVPAPVRLQPAAALRRDKSIEAAGSVSSQALIDVLQGALVLARAEAPQVAALVGDADRHSQRGTELLGATLKTLPQLDAAEDITLTAAVAGHGPAGALMVIATAAAAALQRQQPCLAAALGDTHQRLALLVQPPPAAA